MSAPDAAGLRILLFGRPQAGKSTLLGALAQVAQTQERVLGARLTDHSHGLETLRKRLVDNEPAESLTETASYPVAFEPFANGKPDPARRTELTLIDCDGRVAADLASQPTIDEANGSLARELLDADAVLLVIDIAAGGSKIESDLDEAARFLHSIERARGQRTRVGLTPMVLVLSKCDLLALPGEERSRWVDRIEARKREIGERFRDFHTGAGVPAFGDIDLRVVAVASKQPDLAGVEPGAREPWGVAELFRSAVAAAAEYRRRQEQSQMRLFWTLLGSVALAIGCSAFAYVLFQTRQSLPAVALTSKVESFRAREGPTTATRLAEPLPRKLSELSDLRTDPEFSKLSLDLQTFVRERHDEMSAYRDYKDRLMQLRAPAELRTDDDLGPLERRLRESLPLPPAYEAEWKQTDAALTRNKWLDDINLLQQAAGQVTAWYRQLSTRAVRVLTFADLGSPSLPLSWTRWQEEVAATLREADSPPFRPGDTIRDSRAVGAARPATYVSVLAYPKVAAASADWLKQRARLERTRDFAAALGLGNDAAVFRLNKSFDIAQARDVLSRLQSEYPNWKEWSLAEIADPGATAMRQAVNAAYGFALEPGKREIARRATAGVTDGKVSAERWRSVAQEVAAEPELREYRELLVVLSKWLDPAAPDPFAAFVAFTSRTQFEVEVQSVRLTIPDDVRGQRFLPQGNFTLSIQYGGEPPFLIALKPADEGVRDGRRRVTTYAFTTDRPGAISVKPGAEITGELVLRDASGQAWQFSWYANGVRTLAYQFDRFDLPPRLHRADRPIDDGELAAGVTVTLYPERGWPRLPDLLPSVR